MQITTTIHTIAMLPILAMAVPFNTPQSNTTTPYPLQPTAAIPPVHLEPNYNTAGWKSYIGFLAFGIIAAVLWVGVVGTLFGKAHLEAWRVKKAKKEIEKKVRDVEMAYIKMKRPERVANVGRERV
jgi:hypothetical protein